MGGWGRGDFGQLGPSRGSKCVFYKMGRGPSPTKVLLAPSWSVPAKGVVRAYRGVSTSLSPTLSPDPRDWRQASSLLCGTPPPQLCPGRARRDQPASVEPSGSRVGGEAARLGGRPAGDSAETGAISRRLRGGPSHPAGSQNPNSNIRRLGERRGRAGRGGSTLAGGCTVFTAWFYPVRTLPPLHPTPSPGGWGLGGQPYRGPRAPLPSLTLGG